MDRDVEVMKQGYVDALAPEGKSKYLAFDSRKLSGGKLFTNFLLLTLACRLPMSQKKKMSKQPETFVTA